MQDLCLCLEAAFPYGQEGFPFSGGGDGIMVGLMGRLIAVPGQGTLAKRSPIPPFGCHKTIYAVPFSPVYRRRHSNSTCKHLMNCEMSGQSEGDTMR
jgi:hypothetical protein